MTSIKRLLVCGGTGFLGRKICETAVAHGWEVTSLSRSGRSAFKGPLPSWAEKVKFERFDIMQASPSDVRPWVDSADAVVYSLGILLESNYYKTFVSSSNPFEGASKVVQKWNRNPLKHGIEDEVTYENMNRDLAIKLANETSKSDGVKPFVYISAAGGFPLIPQAYFKTKEQAETAIGQMLSLRAIFLRPGFMFDPSRPMSMYMALGLKTIGSVNSLLGGNAPLISYKALKPITTSVVAAAAVQALADKTVSGVIDRERLVKLATEASRST
ncbi:hypothetical protein V1520DRAFT_330930 [Lipomyces starkeyi]|uniref:NAD(P)-binding domain-containing protein n=1 Tax=Lipomyces starkeyi NRRL Y-11557 TaxID=675824 RepID=A0A1E3PWR9_LIPST|nr:hypothetical protein LIPSTDRAFT_6435 [Lipomyces starkeyi NRRL Y-11557]